MVTRRQISSAVLRGTAWLKSRQNNDGGYGKWNPGSTASAVMALLSSNVPNEDPAIASAVNYLLNSELSDSTYFRSLTVIALTANGNKSPDILKRVQTDVKWLLQAQCNDPGDTFSFGGWGHTIYPLLADGSNTQHALLALYRASGWDMEVPWEIFSRALAWYRRNYDVNKDGSCFYNFKNKSQLTKKEVIYSMTSGVLTSMKIINMLSPDPDVKTEAQYLFDRAWHWLNNNYDVELSPDASDSWRYYYLYSLKNGCGIKPANANIGNYDWYDDIAGYLISRQEPDGGWSSKGEKESTRIIYTSFALITLSNDVITAGSKDQTHTTEKEVEVTPASQSGLAKMLDEIFGDKGQKSAGVFDGYTVNQEDIKGDEEYSLHDGNLQDTVGEELYGGEESIYQDEKQNDNHIELINHTFEKHCDDEGKTKYLVIKQNPDGKWEIYMESNTIEPGHTNDDVAAPPGIITDTSTDMLFVNDWKEDIEEESYLEPTVKHDVIHISVNAGENIPKEHNLPEEDNIPEEFDIPKEHDVPEDKEEKGGITEKSTLQSFIEHFWSNNTGNQNSGAGNGWQKPWYTQMITGRNIYETETTGDQRMGETNSAHPLDAFVKSLWGAKK